MVRWGHTFFWLQSVALLLALALSLQLPCSLFFSSPISPCHRLAMPRGRGHGARRGNKRSMRSSYDPATTASCTGRSRSSSPNLPISRTSLVLADVDNGVLSGMPAAAQSVTTGADSPWLSEASLQQLLEVLQERVRTQVDANAAQIPQLIAQSSQTVPAATAPPPIVSPSTTQRPPGMCECKYK